MNYIFLIIFSIGMFFYGHSFGIGFTNPNSLINIPTAKELNAGEITTTTAFGIFMKNQKQQVDFAFDYTFNKMVNIGVHSYEANNVFINAHSNFFFSELYNKRIGIGGGMMNIGNSNNISNHSSMGTYMVGSLEWNNTTDIHAGLSQQTVLIETDEEQTKNQVLGFFIGSKFQYKNYELFVEKDVNGFNLGGKFPLKNKKIYISTNGFGSEHGLSFSVSLKFKTYLFDKVKSDIESLSTEIEGLGKEKKELNKEFLELIKTVDYYDESLSSSDKLIDKESLEFIQLSNNYLRQGKTNKAISLLKKAVRINSSSIDLHLQLASLYFFQNQIDKFNDQIKKAIDINPLYYKLWEFPDEIFITFRDVINAKLNLEDGQYEKNYQNLVKFRDSLSEKKRIHEELLETEVVVDILQKELFFDPLDSELYLQLLNILIENEEYKQALFILDEVLIFFPDNDDFFSLRKEVFNIINFEN